GSVDYRHDEWRIDVTVAGSQKGLMLPPGLSFNAISDKALAAHEDSTLPKSVWNWTEMLDAGKNGMTPYTPNTNILFGLTAAWRAGAPDDSLGARGESPVGAHVLSASAGRGRPGQRLPRAHRIRKGDSGRRRALGSRGAVHEPIRVRSGTDGGRHARGPRRR